MRAFLAAAVLFAGCSDSGPQTYHLELIAGAVGASAHQDGVGSDARFAYISGIVASEGRIFVADYGGSEWSGGYIREIAPDGTVSSPVSTVVNPVALAGDVTGNLVVAEEFNKASPDDRVSLVDLTTYEYRPVVEQLPVRTMQLNRIASGGDGRVFLGTFYSTSQWNSDSHSTIWRIDGSNVVELNDSQPPPTGPIEEPWAVTLLGVYGDEVFARLGSTVLSMPSEGGPLTPRAEIPASDRAACWIVDTKKSLFGCSLANVPEVFGHGTPPLIPGDPGPSLYPVVPAAMAIAGDTLVIADRTSVHRLVAD